CCEALCVFSLFSDSDCLIGCALVLPFITVLWLCDLSLLLPPLCVDGELVCAEGYTQVTGVMAMMMTGRVLLVCALCVLWCGAGGGFCKQALEDDFCDKSYVEVLSSLANKTDDELKQTYCKNKDDETTCLKTLKKNIADALKTEKTKEDDATDREPDVSKVTGVSVGSPKTKSPEAVGVNTAVLSTPLSLNVDGGFDAQIHSPAGVAGHQQHSDDGRSEAEQGNHQEAGRCSEGQDASGGCSHVPASDAATEGPHQHTGDMQDKKIHNKDEHTPQTGLKLTEAREGTGGAPAPPQVPPNTAESHEDGSRRVAAPA
ncbi:mucin-associated surface protein (MASP), putative, partial [Trypanosoma cruzi marinkellei]